MTNFNASTKPKDVEIYKVEVGEQEALAKRFKVYGVPLLIYFKNGEEVARELGLRNVEQLEENVNKYLLN